MRNFKNDINRLKRQVQQNPRNVTLQVGHGDAAWTLIYCPNSEHYYAMEMVSNKAIPARNSTIRQAYRIDPNTGRPETDNTEDAEPLKFAVKVFNRREHTHEADVEVASLQQHQSAEDVIMHGNKPTVISPWYRGEPLTDSRGNTTRTIRHLSLSQRIALITDLALQFHMIHHHPRQARIHADIKGQNTIIHVPEAGEHQAKVIDFGSAISLENPEDVMPGRIGGMTPYALPPEIISTLSDTQAHVSLDDVSGQISTKSDVYAMTALFTALLGVNTPYAARTNAVDDGTGLIRLQTLRTQIAQRFTLDGLFEGIPNLPFAFAGNRPCRYYDRVNTYAKTTETVLADQSFVAPCFIKTKNKVLYKAGGQVLGYDRSLHNLAAFEPDIEDGSALTPDQLQRFETLSGISHDNTGENVTPALKEVIEAFLKQMMADDFNDRPSSEAVLLFFTTVQHLCDLAENHETLIDSGEKTRLEIERHFKIGLCELRILCTKPWHVPLIPVQGSDDGIPPAHFDFHRLDGAQIEALDAYTKHLLDHATEDPEFPFTVTFDRSLSRYSVFNASECVDSVVPTPADPTLEGEPRNV